jgi:formiminotetrahydrofolate cyclodeaminase
VAEFLDQLAAGNPTPGGGAAAAVATGLAASLVAMVARYSVHSLSEAHEIAARADHLRHDALALASRDAQAYYAVLEARGRRRAEALSAAADPPLAIAEVAAELATLAGRLARSGNPNLRGDALTGGILAEGAARATVALVEINLGAAGVSDERLDRAGTALAHAAAALRELREHQNDP